MVIKDTASKNPKFSHSKTLKCNYTIYSRD